jgi:small subunit ribosomal protein S21
MRQYNRLSDKKHYNKKTPFKHKVRRRPEEYHIPGCALGIKVLDGNLEIAIKKLKRLVKDSGVLYDLRQRTEFEKPSAKKRVLMQHAKRRQYHISLEEYQGRFY